MEGKAVELKNCIKPGAFGSKWQQTSQYSFRLKHKTKKQKRNPRTFSGKLECLYERQLSEECHLWPVSRESHTNMKRTISRGIEVSFTWQVSGVSQEINNAYQMLYLGSLLRLDHENYTDS